VGMGIERPTLLTKARVTPDCAHDFEKRLPRSACSRPVSNCGLVSRSGTPDCTPSGAILEWHREHAAARADEREATKYGPIRTVSD